MDTQKLLEEIDRLKGLNSAMVDPPPALPLAAFGAGAVLQAAIGTDKLDWLMGQLKDGAPTLLAWARTDEFKEWVTLGLEAYESSLKPDYTPPP
jgi:hypothetical protein